jgi:hypothetical protein
LKKKIVCFANSRKLRGRCFAGKDIDKLEWIRPVSNRSDEELYEREECLKNIECNCIQCRPIIPKLLDIIEVELDRHIGCGHQIENYLIGNSRWKKVGVIKASDIDLFLDNIDTNLWVDGYGTWYRKNDKIPIELSTQVTDSLKLIEVALLTISVKTEGIEFNNPKKKVRGKFQINHKEYIIPITDKIVEDEYIQYPEGEYNFGCGNRIVLCLSLGKEYNGFLYKFISGIIQI